MRNKVIAFLCLGRGVLLSVLLLCLSPEVVWGQDSTHKIYSLYDNKGLSAQSAACYGDYLVQVKKYVSMMSLYNLRTKKSLCVCELQPWKELRGSMDIYHANNCSFGLQKFKESDVFPLLYVSHRENNSKRGVLQVFRIQPVKSSNEKTDYDSLIISLVQTVYFPRMTDDNALGSPWTVIDKDHNCMYTYSRNNRKSATNKGICRISKFKIPAIGDSAEVFLNDNDILDSYEVTFKAPLAQGACIYKGLMYIAQGKPNKYVWLRIIDLEKRKLVRSINLKEEGFPSEPEGCFIYRNHLMISTGKRIFKINIPI